MPLTPFQTAVLRLLAQNRSAASYVAGGIVLNAREPCPFGRVAYGVAHKLIEGEGPASSHREMSAMIGLRGGEGRSQLPSGFAEGPG